MATCAALHRRSCAATGGRQGSAATATSASLRMGLTSCARHAGTPSTRPRRACPPSFSTCVRGTMSGLACILHAHEKLPACKIPVISVRRRPVTLPRHLQCQRQSHLQAVLQIRRAEQLYCQCCRRCVISSSMGTRVPQRTWSTSPPSCMKGAHRPQLRAPCHTGSLHQGGLLPPMQLMHASLQGKPWRKLPLLCMLPCPHSRMS